MNRIIKKIIKKPFNYFADFFIGIGREKSKRSNPFSEDLLKRKRVKLYELLLKVEKSLHNSNELIFNKLERPLGIIEKFKKEKFVRCIIKIYNEINN